MSWGLEFDRQENGDGFNCWVDTNHQEDILVRGATIIPGSGDGVDPYLTAQRMQLIHEAVWKVGFRVESGEGIPKKRPIKDFNADIYSFEPDEYGISENLWIRVSELKELLVHMANENETAWGAGAIRGNASEDMVRICWDKERRALCFDWKGDEEQIGLIEMEFGEDEQLVGLESSLDEVTGKEVGQKLEEIMTLFDDYGELFFVHLFYQSEEEELGQVESDKGLGVVDVGKLATVISNEEVSSVSIEKKLELLGFKPGFEWGDELRHQFKQRMAVGESTINLGNKDDGRAEIVWDEGLESLVLSWRSGDVNLWLSFKDGNLVECRNWEYLEEGGKLSEYPISLTGLGDLLKSAGELLAENMFFGEVVDFAMEEGQEAGRGNGGALDTQTVSNMNLDPQVLIDVGEIKSILGAKIRDDCDSVEVTYEDKNQRFIINCNREGEMEIEIKNKISGKIESQTCFVFVGEKLTQVEGVVDTIEWKEVWGMVHRVVESERKIKEQNIDESWPEGEEGVARMLFEGWHLRGQDLGAVLELKNRMMRLGQLDISAQAVTCGAGSENSVYLAAVWHKEQGVLTIEAGGEMGTSGLIAELSFGRDGRMEKGQIFRSDTKNEVKINRTVVAKLRKMMESVWGIVNQEVPVRLRLVNCRETSGVQPKIEEGGEDEGMIYLGNN